MGAQLTREICVCGVDSRADGKLDATWTAPPLLQRLPSHPHARSSTGQPPLPGSLPGSLPEERTPQLSARALAARLLADAKNGRTDSVKALLDAAELGYQQSAALLGATDQSAGNTPLMLAAKNGYADCCTLLVNRGADIHAHNRNKQTAIDLAGACEQLWARGPARMFQQPIHSPSRSRAALHGHTQVVDELNRLGAIEFPAL